MENRIIKATFIGSQSIVTTAPAYRFNYGNILEFEGLDLPQAFEVHFSNSETGDSTTSIGQDNAVEIPNIYFKGYGSIFAWVYLHDTESDGETVKKVVIPLRERANITNYEPTPVQQDAITQAIAALDSAVEKCEASVEKYPEIIGGFWYVYDAESGEMVNTGIKAEGEQGETGATPNLTVGSTQTGEPGTQAQVTITGTPEDPELNFVIPRGDKGDTGESSHIWFSYEAPTMEGILAIFQISDLQSDTTDSPSPKDFELIFYGSWYYVITSVTSTVARCLVYRNLKGDTGATGADGKSASIWYSDEAPLEVLDVYTFNVSHLHGESQVPQVNEIIFYNSDYYIISSVTGGVLLNCNQKISIKGATGATGANGQDGFSPIATITKSGDTATISITDKNGTTTATVSDGDPTTIIDDTSTAANKTWSAEKLNGLLIADITNEVFGGGT